MARNSRLSETYRRRLWLSSREVMIAAVVTALAGAAILTAVWKPSQTGPQTAAPAEPKPSQ